MEQLPNPLTPLDCDLKDFKFMPLDVARLRDSDLASDETPEACWAAVLLWAASWHQVPAASVPDSDQWLAKHAGYVSRGKVAKEWADVRIGALRGWIKCSDGRLYHPVVAEKAIDAWESKLEQRWRSECNRIKKHGERHGLSLHRPTFEEWVSQGCPSGQRLHVPSDKQDCPQTVTGDKRSKGQGERQGQGDLNTSEDKSSGASPPRSSGPVSAQDQVFAIGVTLLTAEGVSDKNARSFLAMQCKSHGPEAVVQALQQCAEQKPVQAIPWLQSVLKAKSTGKSRPDDRKTRQLQTAALMTGAAPANLPMEALDVESRIITA